MAIWDHQSDHYVVYACTYAHHWGCVMLLFLFVSRFYSISVISFFFLNGRAATWNWLVYDERSKCCEWWSHLCVCSSIINNHISISRLRIPWASYQRPEQIDPQVLTRTYFSHFKLFLHFPSRIVLIQRGKTGSTFWHIKVKESI